MNYSIDLKENEYIGFRVEGKYYILPKTKGESFGVSTNEINFLSIAFNVKDYNDTIRVCIKNNTRTGDTKYIVCRPLWE